MGIRSEDDGSKQQNVPSNGSDDYRKQMQEVAYKTPKRKPGLELDGDGLVKGSSKFMMKNRLKNRSN